MIVKILMVAEVAISNRKARRMDNAEILEAARERLDAYREIASNGEARHVTLYEAAAPEVAALCGNLVMFNPDASLTNPDGV